MRDVNRAFLVDDAIRHWLFSIGLWHAIRQAHHQSVLWPNAGIALKLLTVDRLSSNFLRPAAWWLHRFGSVTLTLDILRCRNSDGVDLVW